MKYYEEKERFITLCDGTEMGDDLIVFETNAPIKELKELEQISCQAYIDGNEENIPIWSNVLQDKGYTFKYINQHQHITPYGTSGSWIEECYPKIKEHYVIENQPMHK